MLALRRPPVCVGLLLAALILESPARSFAQAPKGISAVYEGWRKLPDGSYELLFGYFNRNSVGVDIPVGPNNTLLPSPADQGQPTYFLPGRQRNTFRVKVRGDFKGRYQWTLNYGLDSKAGALLDPLYEVDIDFQIDQYAPKVSAGSPITVKVSEAAQLKPTITDDGKPKQRPRIVASWSKYRGPGKVTFGDGETSASVGGRGGGGGNLSLIEGHFNLLCPGNPPAATCGATTARFSEPGTYQLRVLVNDGALEEADVVTVTVTP